MNTNKRFQTVPKFGWPNSNNITNDFGNLGGCYFSNKKADWEFMNENQSTGVVPITPIKQYFPHTRRYEESTNIHRNIYLSGPYFAQTAVYMHETIPDFDIPQDFLAETLSKEALLDEEYMNDPCIGTQLISICDYSFVNGQPLQYMIFPTGIAGSTLCMTPLQTENNFHDLDFKINQLEPNLSNVSYLSFKTPIRQVATSKSESWTNIKSPSLMAVRTMTGTTFFKFARQPDYNLDQSFIKPIIEPIAMDIVVNFTDEFYDHMHVTFNPVINGEAAIVDKYGGVHIWRAERPNSSLENSTSILLPSPQIKNPLSELWKVCEYGAHPQSLLVASRTNIDLYDFRTKVGSPAFNLYNVEAGEKIFAFQRFPMMNSFQAIFSTDSEIDILDQRFPKRPLIRCLHNFSSTISGFNIIAEKKKSHVLAWSKDFASLKMFQFLSNDNGLITVSNNPCSIPSFHTHPDFLPSKYLRMPDLTQSSYSYCQPVRSNRLPYLSSALLLQNDVQYLSSETTQGSIADSNCFNVFQLSQTGALYKQTFYRAGQPNLLIPKYKHPKLFDTQFVDMPNSVAALHYIADKDLGTTPDLRLKQYQSVSLEILWNHISKAFKSSSSNYNLETLDLNHYTSFSNWEDVDRFFKEYGDRIGFNCHRRSMLMDAHGNVSWAKFKCSEVDYDPRFLLPKSQKFSPCKWSITLGRSKTNNSVIVINFNKQHNHRMFSLLYYSERWRSSPLDYVTNNFTWGVAILSALIYKTEYKASKTITPLLNDKIKLMHDGINKSLHPSTIYETLKNLRSSINIATWCNSEIIRHRNFSKFFQLINDDENEEIIMIDWTSANMEEITSVPPGMLLSDTILSQYGFPLNKIKKHHGNGINDTLTQLKKVLKEAYPLPIINKNNYDSCFKQGRILNTDLDLESQNFRNHAIHEVARDITYSSIVYTSILQDSSKFIFSSVESEAESTDTNSFPLIFSKDGLLNKENNVILDSTAKSIVDDWVIGEDYTNFKYEFS